MRSAGLWGTAGGLPAAGGKRAQLEYRRLWKVGS